MDSKQQQELDRRLAQARRLALEPLDPLTRERLSELIDELELQRQVERKVMVTDWKPSRKPRTAPTGELSALIGAMDLRVHKHDKASRPMVSVTAGPRSRSDVGAVDFPLERFSG